MTTKTITIAGKEVKVAYCYATEIAFTKYTGTGIDKFDANDPEHVLYLIIAAIIAYSQSIGEEPAVRDEDLMYNSKPKELVDALAVIFRLRAEWYEVPAEPEDEEKGDEPKND